MYGMTLKLAPENNRLHEKIITEVDSRIKMAEHRHGDMHETWQKAEDTINMYVPENADDAKRRVERDVRGRPVYTTLKVPYSYALLMSAHTYVTSVFFGRSPVLQFAGRHGETEMSVQALEAVIAYQNLVGRMMAPYYLWVYDAWKYGTGIIGTYWDKEIHHYSQLTQDETGNPVYVTNQVAGYSGNKVYNISPWDFLPDPRVPVNQFHRGEFCAIYRTISWNELKLREAQGYYMNVDRIQRSYGRPLGRDMVRNANQPAQPNEQGDLRSGKPQWVGAYEVYVTLIPSDWGLGSMKMPEKWVFTVTADCTLCIQAQPLGLVSQLYPIDIWQPEPDAYGLWARGLPAAAESIQNTMDWLINSHFYNVRSMANGRYVYDPSRIDAAGLEEGTPGWTAALRPEAWGTVTDIRQVFMQLQATDATAMHMQDFERMFAMGERAFGISDQIMGAMGSGRKTATEVRTTAGFGVNRLKTSSEYMSAGGFMDHAGRLVKNTQQYMDAPLKVRIVGDLMKFAGPQFMQVTPEAIAGDFDFVPVDGTMPVDRFAQATLWKDILGQLRGFPQLMMQYDLGKIFAWVAGLAGIKNMDQFRIAGPLPVQVMPDEVLNQQAEAGNLIPFKGSTGAGPGTQVNRATTPSVGVI